MIHPLRLRLRLMKLWQAPEGATCLHVLEVGGKLAKVAALEFENPLNGSWHPVEVVDDEKPD